MIKPMGDRVVVKEVKPDKVSKGGIHIPEPAQEKTQQGIVIAAGPDTILKVDDKVLYAKYSGTSIILEEERVLVLKEDDVYARLVE